MTVSKTDGVRSPASIERLKQEFLTGKTGEKPEDESVFKPDKKPPEGEPRTINSPHFGKIQVRPGRGRPNPENNVAFQEWLRSTAPKDIDFLEITQPNENPFA